MLPDEIVVVLVHCIAVQGNPCAELLPTRVADGDIGCGQRRVSTLSFVMSRSDERGREGGGCLHATCVALT
jgi:hypothetical protein